jgi:molybdopterin converting factor small subunit
MKADTELVLFGSLKKEMADVDEDSIRFELVDPMPLLEILQIHKIPVNRVQLAMVNHSAVPKNSIIHPGDRLALFPKEYVVFADWHDLKF